MLQKKNLNAAEVASLSRNEATMTTDKARVTIYLADLKPLDDLREELRTLAPIEARGGISRSTAIEAAITVALADLRERGRKSGVYKTLVTSP